AVEKGTLSIDSDTVIKAGETTIADGASISGNTSSISITGNDGGATIVLDPDGSFGDGSIVNATVTNASLTIGAAPVKNQIIGFSMGISTMSLGEPTTYDQWIENSTLTTTTITMNGTSLGMDTVTISADTSFDFTGISTIDASNLTLNTGDVTLDATSGTLTIGTFSGVDAMSIEGSLTINIVLSDTELGEFASMLASNMDVAFIVAGVDDYVSADVELIIGSTTNSAAYSYSSTSGVSITGDGLVITADSMAIIPEPSTATLSLLALAGLLARRRRRQA
ncbi:MAG: PEP-CTERM sorting domain-containing protein, partial [Akkermansia sp.]